MEKVKIDKNIPIPPKFRALKYPWRKLKIGESFFLSGYLTIHEKHNILSSGNAWCERNEPESRFVFSIEEKGTKYTKISNNGIYN